MPLPKVPLVRGCKKFLYASSRKKGPDECVGIHREKGKHLVAMGGKDDPYNHQKGEPEDVTSGRELLDVEGTSGTQNAERKVSKSVLIYLEPT